VLSSIREAKIKIKANLMLKIVALSKMNGKKEMTINISPIQIAGVATNKVASFHVCSFRRAALV
jgi:uncharacterized Fe-S cluster-containing MiaB family protein